MGYFCVWLDGIDSFFTLLNLVNSFICIIYLVSPFLLPTIVKIGTIVTKCSSFSDCSDVFYLQGGQTLEKK